MADYEKLRRKKEAEANARIDQQREERRIKEQQERDRIRKDMERRHWEELAMEKAKQRKLNDVAQAELQAKAAIKEMEDKKKPQS